MKLTVFQSEDGDCIVLTGADGKMVLADGGRARSYSRHAAQFLAAQLTAGKELETVYISHIDADHIEGILQMLDDLVAWAVFDFQQAQGKTAFKVKTGNQRPMKPKKIWHNSFHEMTGDNKLEISEALAAAATVLSGAYLKEHLQVAASHQDLATSTVQAANISRRIGKKQLNISLNPEFDGKLMLLKEKGDAPPPIKIGKMSWHLIGPFDKDLKKLREDWDKWLDSTKGKKDIEKIKRKAAEDEKNLGNSATEVSSLIGRASLEASMLAETFLKNDFALAAKEEGRDGVTTPNLASLMFLVEEKNGTVTRRVLMTGDGHWRDILAGLEKQNKFDADGNLHVDVLKVQHHGATANVKPDFLKRVTADNYIFCGISARNNNPEVDVVNFVLDSRLVAAQQGTHAKVNDKFTLWFTGNSANPDAKPTDNTQIEEIEKTVAKRANPRFKTVFLKDPSFDLEL